MSYQLLKCIYIFGGISRIYVKKISELIAQIGALLALLNVYYITLFSV